MDMSTAKERQERRTFEILAKYHGQTNGVRIEFSPDMTPQADIKNKVIYLPSNLKTESLYPALALLIHEAGHIRESGFDAQAMIEDQDDFHILNALEDIRIDCKNFKRLNNIKGIHNELKKYIDGKFTPEMRKDMPIESRVMIGLINYFEDYAVNDPEVRKVFADTKILSKAKDTINDLENGRWSDVKKGIQDIRKILKWAKKKAEEDENDKQDKESEEQKGKGDGKGGGKGDNKDNQCKGEDKDPQSGAGDGKNRQEDAPSGDGEGGIDLSGLKKLEEITKSVYGDTTPNAQGTFSQVGEAALEDMTKRTLSEILNSKEKHTKSQGLKLNCDELVDFFTGDIDKLFVDDTIKKVKKSKVMFLLDSSGSMGGATLDGSSRQEVLLSTVKGVLTALKEVQDTEGLNIDWDVRSFDTQYYKLSKENWEKEYYAGGGGTNLLMAFTKAQNEILEDYTIDGNKIVLVITDGEVCDYEVTDMRREVLKHNQDIRCLIIGCGANPRGSFVRNITPFNILAKAGANATLLDAIMCCLEG